MSIKGKSATIISLTVYSVILALASHRIGRISGEQRLLENEVLGHALVLTSAAEKIHHSDIESAVCKLDNLILDNVLILMRASERGVLNTHRLDYFKKNVARYIILSEMDYVGKRSVPVEYLDAEYIDRIECKKYMRFIDDLKKNFMENRRYIDQILEDYVAHDDALREKGAHPGGIGGGPR